MELQVCQDLCHGCGVCTDLCEEGAIQIFGQKAWIDTDLCPLCQACVDACPNGAIIALPVLSTQGLVERLPDTESLPIPAWQPEARLPQEKASTWTALSSLGQAALPYLLDGVALILEQRQSVQSRKVATGLLADSFCPAGAGTFDPIHHRRQRRRRGNRS